MKKIAVLLCGSGFRDGSEIRESVGVLWALSQYKDVKIQCFAPDKPQADVVNCMTGEVLKTEKRNMLVESGRIARGEALPLIDLNPQDFSALVIPGGFGVAKNLCDFATKGAQGSVLPEAKYVIQSFFQMKKPIGAVCIAPALLALALKGQKLELTLGPAGETSQEIEKLGHIHKETKLNECCVDLKHKIVTTPAYMYDHAPLHEMFEGIKKMVEKVVTIST